MPSISWLHLTDLHFNSNANGAIARQSWLWPNVREEFFEDLKRVHEYTGHWDLVFFTGDLAQSGTSGDYDALDEVLARLWALFGSLGCNPLLLAVPGNHDLQWPDPRSSTVRTLLRTWASDKELREIFWADEKNEYRALIQDVFRPYTNWWGRRHPPNSIPYRPGLLPGDFGASYEKDGLKLGIVGLNSTFLQLGAGVREGQLLDLDPRQLHEVCAHDPIDWIKGHDINLLMTHHPPTWLNSEAQKQFRGELAPGERFALHLFGHMHEPSSHFFQQGGGGKKRELQSASLFGLEKWDTPQGEQDYRIHGYTAGRFEKSDERGTLRLWPRKLIRLKDQTPRIISDNEQGLDKEESITVPLSLTAREMEPRGTTHLNSAKDMRRRKASEQQGINRDYGRRIKQSGPICQDEVHNMTMRMAPIIGEAVSRIVRIVAFVQRHGFVSAIVLITGLFMLLHERRTLYGYFGELDCNGNHRINREKMDFHKIRYFGLLFGTSSWEECGKTKALINRGGPYIGFESERTIVIAYKSETLDEDQPKQFGTGVIIATLSNENYIGYTLQYDPDAKDPITNADGAFESCPYVIATLPTAQTVDDPKIKEIWPNMANTCQPVDMIQKKYDNNKDKNDR